jgi:hypothetical protein
MNIERLHSNKRRTAKTLANGEVDHFGWSNRDGIVSASFYIKTSETETLKVEITESELIKALNILSNR